MYKFTMELKDESGIYGSFMVVMNGGTIAEAVVKIEELLSNYYGDNVEMSVYRIIKIEELD